MRRRDIVFAGLAWGALLAGLVWALSTQFRWVQENKPIQVKRPAGEPREVEPEKPGSSAVIGTVTDDTRAAMAKGLGRRPPPAAASSPGVGRANPILVAKPESPR